MKISLKEDKSRKIGSREHNRYVARGANEHKSTNIAPSSLLQAFDARVQQNINNRQNVIENILKKSIGEPFYSDSGFILYQGNSLELLEQLDNDQQDQLLMDLTLTSPPYNIGKEYEIKLSLSKYIEWCSSWMELTYRMTRESGSFWLNIGYIEVPEKGLCVPIPYLLWNKSSFYLIQEVVWKYGAGVSSKRRLSPRNEKWLFYVKNAQSYTFNLDDIRDPNVKYPNQKKNGKFRCNPLGKNPSDVWEFPKVTTGRDRSSKERTGHPAQFPLGIVERIIKVSSNPADIVFDPFSGSCSAGIAASGLGRIFIGFEIRTDYCRLAVERFKYFQEERRLAQMQTTLF